MSVEKKCPTCGATLSAAAVDGLCAKCLARLAFEGSDGKLAGPRRLGDYELIEEIARGGMGVVYRARQLSLNRIVAVKVVLSGPFADRDFVRRFRTEAEAAATLQHPNIVSVHEVGERDGAHFLSMDFVEGRNFSELVREQPLPARRAADYLRTIALAVHHAHERGVLHRDLKPSNILLDAFDQPRVTDFGLAKFLHRNTEPTLHGAVLGTPNFIPPEQAAGNFSGIGPASDVYSLGAILYQLLTGRPPFQGETLTQILQQVQEAEAVPPGKLNPAVPADLQNICLKCLQKESSRRYASARELADDLGLFLAGKPVQARPISVLETSWLWCKRRPALATMILAFHLALAAGLAGILYEWRESNLHAAGEKAQRLAAESNAEAMRLNVYAADVALAGHVMQDGDFGQARRTLEQMIPAPGLSDWRGFEWRYLWNRVQGGQTATLGRHDWIVTCAAFSPGGSIAASGGMGGQVKIWSVAGYGRPGSAAGQPPAPAKTPPPVDQPLLLKTLNVFTSAVWSVAFTADGRELLASGIGGVKLLDTANWQLRTNFPGRLASLSRDSNLLAASESSPFFFDETGPVSLWNRATGEKLFTVPEPGRVPALSPDGKFLAVATETNGVRLYETASKKLLRFLPTKKAVWSLRFSPDSGEILAAGWSGDVYLWNIAGDSAPRIFSANHLNVWDADFSPDGRTILTAGSDQTIRFWNRATLEPGDILRGHQSEVWCAAFSPDGAKIISGGKDQNVMLWTAARRADRRAIASENLCRCLFSPDGSRLITVGTNSGDAFELWDAAKYERIASDLAARHVVAGFAPDGQNLIAIADDWHGLEFWADGAVARRIPLEDLPESLGRFVSFELSADGKWFLAIDAAGMARVWNAETGALRGKFPAPAPPIRSAALSPHGKFAAVCVERQNSVSLFNGVTKQVLSLSGHHDFVSGLAFSPDESTLATGSMDGNIRLWRTGDGACLGVLPGHLEETTDVAFSPDGRTLASLGQRESLKLWHLPTRREVFSESLPHAGHYLKFSPDGKRLAVNTDEGRLLLLEAP